MICTSSQSAASRMIEHASFTSCSPSRLDPVMLIRMPREPAMRVSSRSAQLMACRAASTAAFSPRPTAVPIIAYPMPVMVALMSEKSRLISPGVMMMSLMPCTACRSRSSAVRNASKKLVPRGTSASSRSLGMAITVSTMDASLPSPSSASFMRRDPSKLNGLVTTATASASSSLASDAITGAAPVPVPPPRPAVTNAMSAPCSASTMPSVFSSAACRPTSGFDPAPSPRVIFAPSCSLLGTWHASSACMSVFMA